MIAAAILVAFALGFGFLVLRGGCAPPGEPAPEFISGTRGRSPLLMDGVASSHCTFYNAVAFVPIRRGPT